MNALGEEGLAKLVIVSSLIVNGAAPAEAVKDEETGVATVVAPSELENVNAAGSTRYSRSRQRTPYTLPPLCRGSKKYITYNEYKAKNDYIYLIYRL